MYIFVCLCKFKNFEQKSYFKKNVIAIAIAQNVPLYGQTLFIVIEYPYKLFINAKDTIFESKSQHICHLFL